MAASVYEITGDNKQLLKALDEVNKAIIETDDTVMAFGVDLDKMFTKTPKSNTGYSKGLSELTTKLKLLETTQKELNKLPDGNKSKIEGLKQVHLQMSQVTTELKKYGDGLKKFEELQGFKKAAADAKLLSKAHEDNVKSLDRAAKAQIKLNDAQDKQNTKKAADDAKKLAAALEKAATIQARLSKFSNKKLFNFNAKNITEANAAIAELNKRRNALIRTDKNYLSTLTKINQKQAVLIKQNQQAAVTGLNMAKSVNTTTGALNKQSGVMQQLQRQFGIYFSVIQAQRFVSEMIKIRGEFELQSVALGAMLQDQELANKLFREVQQMALQSPFKILELNKYLKQLKAYRIENEDLIDTLGNLGDISAGLGVNMDRLILAYGQVRAATVLRGTELRQFTEAGIPLVSQLADKFTELRGTVVSTAEVFDLISTRQVSFEMVRDIFSEMTDVGGVFYQQQIKQANTLSGRISVLRDAFDKMLNAMGKSNEGSLKGAIGIARSLVDNYQDVLAVLKVLVTTYGAYRAAVALVGLSGHIKALRILKTATDAATVAQNRLTLASIKNPYVAIATAILAVGTALFQFIKRQNVAEESLRESLRPLQEQVTALKDLKEAYNSSNTDEYLKALLEIKKINPDIVNG